MRFIIVLVSLFPFTLNAQTGDADSAWVKEIVISALRDKTERFTTPELVQVLDEKPLIRLQARTAPEALLRTTGVWVQKTNHGGGSPFVRGLTGNQTLLLVDGIRLNNATVRFGPNQYFNTLDLLSLDKIEILHGSGSVQYGSDAFGGTIQVISRELAYTDKPTWSGRALTRAATRGLEQSLRAETGFSAKNAALYGGFTLRHFGDLVGGDTTGVQTPSGYREQAFDLKGRFRLRKNLDITAVYQQLQQRQVPIFHKIKLENFAVNEFEPQYRNLGYLRADWQIGGQVLQNLQFTISNQQTEEGRISRKNGSNVRREENDQVQVLGANLQVKHQWSNCWSSRTGIDIYRDRVKSRRTDVDETTAAATSKRGLYPDGSSMQHIAAYSLHEWQDTRWTITGGLRFNQYDIRVSDPDIGDVRLLPAALVGNIGVLRRVGRHSALSGSFNTGFRAPNIDDLGTLGIVDFRFEVPNYNLKPEKTYNFQAGYRHQRERFSLETYVFRNELRDLIARIRQDTQMMQGYPVYLKENTEQSYIHGLETQISIRILPSLRLEGALCYTYGQNLTRREPVRRIPPLFGRTALQFERRAWFATAELLFAGEQDRLAAGDLADNRIPVGGTPGWAVFNVYAGYTWKNCSFSAGWQNIGNADYRYHGSGVNGTGSHLSASLAFCW